MDYKKLAKDLLSGCEENCADCEYLEDSEFECTIAELAATTITDLLARAEEAWTAGWLYDIDKDTYNCANCLHTICASDYLNSKLPPYCEMCVRAMTPDAWDELEKRLRGL